MNEKIYAAYGSNMNLAQMADRCSAAKVLDIGYLKDYELVFRGGWNIAVATIEKKKGGRVPVVLWTIEPTDEAALDRYEGYPFLYRKETIDVQTDGGAIQAMVYVMNEGRTAGSPSRYYLDIIAQGYEEAGLSKEALYESAFKTKEKAR